MSPALEGAVALLLVAIAVAIAARRLRLPYTVGLVLTGIILALTHVAVQLNLTHDFIFDVILPPLLFEAALNLQWTELRRDMVPVLTLSTLGVIVSALFVAWGTTQWLGWAWQSSLVFGVLIAATDPVAVIALFKDIGVRGRLRLLVEAESLFNDGAAAVLLALVLSVVAGGADSAPGAWPIVRAFGLTVGGGVAAGAAIAALARLLAGRTADHLVETALTAVVAYGSFFFAERIHTSGVLATVTAGLLFGNRALSPESSAISERGRTFVLDFWEFIAFLANSLIFLLIGLRVANTPFGTLGTLALTAVILLTVSGRALSVYLLCLPFSRTRWAIPLREQHVLWWGGLRGALGLALALSLPPGIALFEKIVVATFGTVAFSVLIQGMTVPFLVRYRKESKKATEERL